MEWLLLAVGAAVLIWLGYQAGRGRAEAISTTASAAATDDLSGNAYWVPIAGEQFANPDGTERQHVIAGLRNGMPIELRREPRNTFDANAIAVFAGGKQIGYLPRQAAAIVAPWLAAKRGRYVSGIIRGLRDGPGWTDVAIAIGFQMPATQISAGFLPELR